jgi:hypothetical protein
VRAFAREELRSEVTSQFLVSMGPDLIPRVQDGASTERGPNAPNSFGL